MSVTVQHMLACVGSNWGLTVAELASAALLAGPDAADLFPHDWMVQAESQRSA